MYVNNSTLFVFKYTEQQKSEKPFSVNPGARCLSCILSTGQFTSNLNKSVRHSYLQCYVCLFMWVMPLILKSNYIFFPTQLDILREHFRLTFLINRPYLEPRPSGFGLTVCPINPPYLTDFPLNSITSSKKLLCYSSSLTDYKLKYFPSHIFLLTSKLLRDVK